MRANKKKVLVLTSTFPRWKKDITPPFVFELESRLAKDFDIYILAPHYEGAKKYEINNNLKIYRFQYFWPAKLQKLCYGGGILPRLNKNKLLVLQIFPFLLSELIWAIRIIKKEKIQLIHAHWLIPQGFVAVLINKMHKIPYIVTAHGGDIYGFRSEIFIRLKKFILNNAKIITVVSNTLKRDLLNKINPTFNIKVISMGVDTILFHPNRYSPTIKEKYVIRGPFLLFVGSLVEKKGVKYILLAMSKILIKYPTAKLIIIGDGEERESLKNLANKLSIRSQISFLGAIPNNKLPPFYATADLFISPSIITDNGDREGLPVTFLEASFSGFIPRGTNVGEISEIIKDGASGFIVKQKDASEIAARVITLLKNQDLRSKLSKNARKATINKYSWSIITKHHSNLYSDL